VALNNNINIAIEKNDNIKTANDKLLTKSEEPDGLALTI
jgi:hypothetical protein